MDGFLAMFIKMQEQSVKQCKHFRQQAVVVHTLAIVA
jgi:hypothetical protein